MGKDMRAVYTDTLIELAKKDTNIVVLEADLMNATGTKGFKQAFPERTFDVGVSEADMVGVASGLSATGKIPFAASFGCFAGRRTFDQFFLAANYAKQNVKLVGTDPGVTAQLNGGTHMPFEDIAMMRAVPKLVIVEACDIVSLEKLIEKIAYHKGSVYMRMQRKGSVTIYNENEEFELGKGKIVREGSDVTIVANGFVMVPEALAAAEILAEKGISAEVIDMHTIKPFDEELLLKSVEKTNAVLTCENHQIMGGLGSAVAESLSRLRPTRQAYIGVHDMFGQVGDLDYLMKAYNLTKEDIAAKAEELVKNK